MKNRLIDLNNHLFAQMERLNAECLESDALKTEINRSKAISLLATSIINNGKLGLQAKVAVREGLIDTELPRMLDDKNTLDRVNDE